MKSKRVLHMMIALAFAMQMAVGMMTPAYGGTTGIISGTIRDYATGEPLPGVNVIVDGTRLTTVTDESGYYVITNVPPGTYQVTASLVGYTEIWLTNVSVIMDVTTAADFLLEQSVAETDDIVIVEARPMIRRDVVPTMYVLDHEQEQLIRNQPNILYQVPSLVRTMPGVVADAEGYPHIRGGRDNQVAYLLDGIPITESLTNGFGTNIVTVGLDKMEMYTGGYRPEYGNAISGVFNQAVKTGRNAPGASLEMLGGSQSFMGMYPQLGGVTESGFDYYVGAYLWRSEIEGSSYNEADSSDMIGKFTYPMDDRSKLTLLVGRGAAKYQFPSEHTWTYRPEGMLEIAPRRDFVSQGYTLAALTYNHTLDSSSYFTVRPYYFQTQNTMEGLSDDIGFWWDRGSTATGLQVDYTNQISSQHLLKVGAIRTASRNKYWAKVPSYGTYEYTANTDTVQTGLYIQDQMRLDDRWGIDFGVRYDHILYDKEVNENSSASQISPRFGVSYAADSDTNLRFSYGRMIQFVYTQALERNYTDPMWDFYYGNADLKPERCTQFDIGLERQFSRDYSIQLTPFYREYKDLLQTTFLDPTQPHASPIIYDNLGEGISRGVELLLSKRHNDNWSGWLSYTYSTAKAHASSDRAFFSPDEKYYVDWDQRHTASLVLNYTRDGWAYSLLGEYGSGLPYGPTNTMRASPYAVLNLNVSKEVTGGWLPQGRMHLSIANIFNTRTALKLAEDLDPVTYEPQGWVVTNRVPPRFISLSYSRSF